MKKADQKVVVIVGPTASGKSGLSVRLAKKFNGEVISADSRQVYKGLNIGTGKVTKKEMRDMPHHLLDVASPKNKFSAGDFVRHAEKALSDIKKRGHVAIVAGGTGFYIDSLFGRFTLPDVPPNAKLRASLAKKSATQLFALLKKKDPARAKAMDTLSERNNAIRLIRALEIASFRPGKNVLRSNLSTKPVGRSNLSTKYEALWIGISPSATQLEKNIRIRLVARMRAGMVAEAQRLKKQGLSYKRMRELGLEYRSLADLLEKKITKEDCVDILYREIRRYARKQTGYWNRNKDIEWFDPADVTKIEKRVSQWLVA